MNSPNNSPKGDARSSDIRPRAYSYIRFSSPEQARGDSRRRQIEASRAYADEHGLEMDEMIA